MARNKEWVDPWDFFLAVKIWYKQCSEIPARAKWAKKIMDEYKRIEPSLKEDVRLGKALEKEKK